LSDRFKRRLALNGSSVLGQRIRLNGQAFTIVGVAPRGFRGVYHALFGPDVWVPVSAFGVVSRGSDLMARGTNSFRLMGRLRPGVSYDQGNSAVAAIGRRLERDFPVTNAGFDAVAMPELKARPEPDDAGGSNLAARAFLVVVGLVLLIACANVANLLLARAASRRKEIALRLALGAGRLQLLRQLLIESTVLGLLGGALGMGLAIWATAALGNGFHAPSDIPFQVDFSPDRRVLGFTLAISLLTSLVFGLVPALQAARPEVVGALKNEPAQRHGSNRSLLRGGLVITQVALSCILLIGTGLMLETLGQMKRIDPGFDARNGLLVSVSPALLGYDQRQGESFYHRVLEGVRQTPGVQGATLAQYVPLEFSASGGGLFVSGPESDQKNQGGDPTLWSVVEHGYLGLMGTRLLDGRDFSLQDDSTAPRVAIVNQALAQRYWPRASPIGKTIRLNAVSGPPIEIIGVAANGKYRALAEPQRPYLYLPLSQNYTGNATLVVRSTSDPLALLPAIREAIHRADPDMPAFDTKTMQELIEGRALLAPRFATGLAGVFGLLALGLAMVGLYGLISYSVSRRTREMGIRIALGAPLRAVRGMVVGDGFRVAGIGIVLGTAGAAALTRLVRSLFFGMNPSDAKLLFLVPLVLIVIALLASYLPARRATKVDPMVALRSE
ncbi:MAG TPA: ADOP family duplicated permease, partial [Gemmatimonadales bacterium]|nr:ADOP family duplicated permease [Gemmatimonadales bacterium]